MGGENSVIVVSFRSGQGSSPRGRGKRRSVSFDLRTRGLIPAWAGKTATSTMRKRRLPAHPRVGGENSVVVAVFIVRSGSSPRGRGKHLSAMFDRSAGGLIPAWAGKTTATTSTVLRPRAHPRVGGENAGGAGEHLAGAGSSPRGRGKLNKTRPLQADQRLIPAWAGKTRSIMSRAASRQAHPRVGGENAVMNHPAAAALGSSPRGRGKR